MICISLIANDVEHSFHVLLFHVSVCLQSERVLVSEGNEMQTFVPTSVGKDYL